MKESLHNMADRCQETASGYIGRLGYRVFACPATHNPAECSEFIGPRGVGHTIIV